MNVVAVALLLLVALPAIAHDDHPLVPLEAVWLDFDVQVEAVEAVEVAPLKLRIVVEPSPVCSALVSQFTVAMKAFVINDNWKRANKVINVAQEAVHKGCWK